MQLQKLIFEAEGAVANDLVDGDDGCGGGRVVRKKKAEGSAGNGKRKHKLLVDAAGYEYWSDETFNIEDRAAA